MAISRIPAITERTVEFTSSGTWVCPSGVYSADFLVVGAGGAGGGTATSTATNRSACGGGGGGGAVKYRTLPVTPGNSYTITVGAGGTGAAALGGGNGGFSEVVLSGSTLIRSYGGTGGQGATALDAIAFPAVTATGAGYGGAAARAAGTQMRGGGGGGALRTAEGNTASQQNEIFALEGRFGDAADIAAGINLSVGGMGIDGFGAGGGPGVTATTTNVTLGQAPFGAGTGAVTNANGTFNGNAATVAGCGGGGSTNRNNTTPATGGNGANGLVRITYVG